MLDPLYASDAVGLTKGFVFQDLILFVGSGIIKLCETRNPKP